MINISLKNIVIQRELICRLSPINGSLALNDPQGLICR